MTERDVRVDVVDLTKHYGPIRAVDGISFQVARGEVLGFLGPNGAGKTTAMKMITGFLEPDAGSVTVAGHPVATESLAARRAIGYLPENAPAYGEMTVAGFLEFVAEAREVEAPGRAIDRVVGRCGLGRVVHQSIDTLSKGFRRRVGLAQALVHDPEVLILDEPTDGLDPNQKALVHELIGELAADRAIILSTHILDEVERVCNRALIISRGKILVDSTPEELIARAPDHNVIRVTLGAEPDPALEAAFAAEPWCARVERVASAVGVVLDLYPADGGNHLAAALERLEGADVHGVHLQEGRLDELFREITGGVAA